jgi:hypothetical protein
MISLNARGDEQGLCTLKQVHKGFHWRQAWLTNVELARRLGVESV